MTVLLLAQAGVPFTTGFFAKFYVVSAAVDQRQYALAVLAMLAAAVAAFFYLRVAIFMYSPLPQSGDPVPAHEPGATVGAASVGAAGGAAGGPRRGSAGSAAGSAPDSVGTAALGGLALAAPPETGPIAIPGGITIALAICLAFTIVFGVAPAPLIHFAQHAHLFF